MSKNKNNYESSQPQRYIPPKSVREKINEGYYDNNKQRYYMKVQTICPKCNSSFDRTDSYCSKCGTKVDDWFKDEVKKNDLLKKEYAIEDQRLYELFKNEAITEVGLQNHPKCHKIFSYAWGQGHSDGNSEVFNCLSELAEMLRD